MEDTGTQLHPNWRALATVHIPLKRFIKEGLTNSQINYPNSHEKYALSGISGGEIKEFYEKLVNEPNKEKTLINRIQTNIGNKNKLTKQLTKLSAFENRSFFQFAMENKVVELQQIDFDGKNINVCDDYGWSALMMASCAGAYEAVEFLLTLGVDRYIKDKSGKTARDLAYKKGNLNIVKLLEKEHWEIVRCIQREPIEDQSAPFYCEICKQNFLETSETQHYLSTVHRFQLKSNLPLNKLQKFNISPHNKGLQLMIKQGWDRETGLGPFRAGRLYPIKTVIRKQRTGLGIEQDPARVTHFKSNDCKSVLRNTLDYYKRKPRNRNDIRREKVREWKRDRRLRNELN